MAEAASSPKVGKLDNLPKEELIKYIRKQASQIKDFKKKNEDLSTLLEHEKQEVDRLEQEKKSWLARGVSAEFEKKEKIAKKDRELRIAAQLGQKMLTENDELRSKFCEQETEHQRAVQDANNKVQEIMEENNMLQETLKAVQAEYKLAKEEAKNSSKALEQALGDQERENEKNEREILNLTEKIKELEDLLTREREGKGEVELLKEDIWKLKKENDEVEATLKMARIESEGLRNNYDVNSVKLEESERKCQQLDEELMKVKADKEKAVKSIKVLKTKAERGYQIEEELRRQLATICGERDDIQSKHISLQREKKTLVQNVKKLKEKLRVANRDQKDDEGSEKSKDSPRGSDQDFSVEYATLKESYQRLKQEKEELYEQYEAVKAEIYNIEGERSEMEHMIKSYETEVLKLNDKFEILKKEHDAVKFENDENHATKMTLEEENERLLSVKECLKNDLEKNLEEKERIIGRYSALEEELNNLKSTPLMTSGESESGNEVTYSEIDLVKSEVIRLDEVLSNVREQNSKSQAEITELKEVIMQKDSDLKVLTKEKGDLEKQCEAYLKQLKEREKIGDDNPEEKVEQGNTEKSLVDETALCQQELLDELIRIKESCSKLELDLETSQQRSTFIESEVQQLRSEKESLEGKCRDYVNRMESLEFERAEISTNAQEDLARLTEENQMMTIELEKKQQDYNYLEELCKELKDQNYAMSSKQQEHKANVTRLQGRVDELLSMLQSLNEEKMHQESEIEELFKAQDELHNKYDMECHEKKSKELVIKDLEDNINTLEKELEKSDQNYKLSQETIESNEEQIKLYKAQIQTLEETLAKNQDKLNKICAKTNGDENSKENESQEICSAHDNGDQVSSHEDPGNKTTLLLCGQKIQAQEAIKNQETERLEDVLQANHELVLKMKQNDSVLEAVEETNIALQKELKEISERLKDAEESERECIALRKTLSCLLGHLKLTEEDTLSLQGSLNSLLTEDPIPEGEARRINLEIENLLQSSGLKETGTIEKDSLLLQVDDYKQNCNEAQEQLFLLKDEVNKVKNENEELKMGKKSLEDMVSVMSSELDSIRDSSLKQETLKEKLNSVEEELEKKNTRIIELEKDVIALENSVETSKNQLNDLAIECSNIKSELTKKEEELLKTQKAFTKVKQAFQNQKGKIERVNDNLKQASDAFEEEKGKLMNKIEEKDTVIGELKNTEITLLEQLEQQKQDICRLSERSSTDFIELEKQWKCLVDEKDEKIYNLENSLSLSKEEMNTTATKLEQTLYDVNVQYHTLVSEKENVDNVSKQLNQELEETREKMNYLYDEKKCLENDVEKKSLELGDAVREKEELLQKFSMLEIRMGEVANQLESKSVEREATQKVTEEMKDKDDCINAQQQEIQDLKHHCEKLNEEAASRKISMATLEEKVRVSDTTISEYTERLNELQNILEELSNKLEEKEEGSADAKSRIIQLEDELQEAFNRLEEVENTLKEKDEKINKFKGVAMRAKKELDNLRGQIDPEKERLQSANEQLQKIAQQFEAELLRQREDCQRHEEDYEALQKEVNSAKSGREAELIKVKEKEEEIETLTNQVERLTMSIAASENETTRLHEHLALERESGEGLLRNLNDVTKKYEECSRLLSEEQQGKKLIKNQLLEIEVKLESAQKESQNAGVMDLEIQDYRRTIESLQKKISDREERIKDCERQISVLTETITSLKGDLENIQKELHESEEKENKLKLVLAQTKKDLNDSKQAEAELLKKERSLKQEIETTAQILEDYKLQTTDLLGEKDFLLNQLKSNADMNQRSHQALELKLARLQNDLVAAQQAHSMCKQEFESYKIRAQTVLKQQKVKTSEDNGTSLDPRERQHLEQTIEQLKIKVKNSSDHIKVLMHDHEELEVEHERLLSRHNEVLQEIQGVELEWKTRFEHSQKDSTERFLDYEEKFKELTAQKEHISTLYKKQREAIENMEKEHQSAVDTLRRQLEEKQVRNLRNSDTTYRNDRTENKGEQKETITNTSEKPRLTIDTAQQPNGKVTERKEGEGMDASQLETADAMNRVTPASPSSAFESANLLERLLSPVDQTPEMDWIYSPVESPEEGIKLKGKLATLEKKVEHLTEVLRESEANSVRLGDQAKILKDEIRRLEKNQEREEAMHNLEYLKNVTIKFLKCAPTEREYLVPVLSTMLKLNPEEMEFIKEFAKSEQDASEPNSNSWSSYVYRWSSF